MKMEENIYRRSVSRRVDQAVSPCRESSERSSHRSPQSHYRGTNSQAMNLRALKNTSLNCAKNITNKLLTLSNSGIAVASTAINSYRDKSHSRNPGTINVPLSSSEEVIERLVSSSAPVATHRELVIAIESLLKWSRPPVQVTLEWDRLGLPKQEGIAKFRLVDDNLLIKILDYIEGRRDCCLFTVRFVTWKMRTTKYPEEVILSLELLSSCVERFGGHFLALITKSCMRTFRRLLKMTTLKTSIAQGVCKQLTKLIVGSSNVHPGVPTDVRIHVIKAKVLYMLQLWHDVFLLDQGLFPVFFDGYRELRVRGVKFPPVDFSDRLRINTKISVAKSNTSGNVISLPLSPEELDHILTTVQQLYSLDFGPEYDSAITYLRQAKNRIVASISALTENKGRIYPRNPELQEELLERMLQLNDAIGSKLDEYGPGTQSSTKILAELHAFDKDSRKENESVDLLNLGSSSDSEPNEDFDNFFAINSTEKGSEQYKDYEDFFANNDEFEASPSTGNNGGDYFYDLNSLDFGSPATKEMPQRSDTENSVRSSKDKNVWDDHTIPSFEECIDEKANENSCSSAAKANLKTRELEGKSESTEKNGTSENPEDNKEKCTTQKALEEMMSELDNLDFDFGHMSATGF